MRIKTVNVRCDSRLKASRSGAFNHSVTTLPRGGVIGEVNGDESPIPIGEELATLPSVEELTEKTLYWLSLDMRVRGLAERLLDRFAARVDDLLARPGHGWSSLMGIVNAGSH